MMNRTREWEKASEEDDRRGRNSEGRQNYKREKLVLRIGKRERARMRDKDRE